MKKVIGYILYVSGILMGIGLHIYTVYWVYQVHGILWSFISFVTPPFSELLMIGVSIGEYGWINPYFISSVILGICFSIGDTLIKDSSDTADAN